MAADAAAIRGAFPAGRRIWAAGSRGEAAKKQTPSGVCFFLVSGSPQPRTSSAMAW